MLLLQHHVLLCLLTARGGAQGGQSIITCESEEELSLVLYICFICWRAACWEACIIGDYWGRADGVS